MNNNLPFSFPEDDKQKLREILLKKSGFTEDQVKIFLAKAEKCANTYINQCKAYSNGRVKSNKDILDSIDKVAVYAEKLSKVIDGLYPFSLDNISKEEGVGKKLAMNNDIPYHAAYVNIINRLPENQKVKYCHTVNVFPNKVTFLSPEISIFLGELQERLSIIQELPSETRQYIKPDRNAKSLKQIQKYLITGLGLAYIGEFDSIPSGEKGTIFASFFNNFLDLIPMDKCFSGRTETFGIGEKLVISALSELRTLYKPHVTLRSLPKKN